MRFRHDERHQFSLFHWNQKWFFFPLPFLRLRAVRRRHVSRRSYMQQAATIKLISGTSHSSSKQIACRFYQRNFISQRWFLISKANEKHKQTRRFAVKAVQVADVMRFHFAWGIAWTEISTSDLCSHNWWVQGNWKPAEFHTRLLRNSHLNSQDVRQ